jgi:hypothetical protein
LPQLTFYPLGCANTALVELKDGRRVLVDYANRWTGAGDDKRCDLPKLLKADLDAAGAKDYAVVAFTHLDDDHCQGAPDFFYLEHAAVYQGAGRHKIQTLWVPAAAITEEGLTGDARVIRAEARCRLKKGKGIKVFSRPDRLKDWLSANGLTTADRANCFVDAGKLIPEFNLADDGVEFFVHSPHAKRANAIVVEDRNGSSLVFQARFLEGSVKTDVLFSSDVDHEVLAEIVDITRHYGNHDRLHWNIYQLPHHCSYTAIGPDKGTDKTVPTSQIKWLCETQGEKQGYIVSSSDPIPSKGSAEDRNVQPPHRQAAEYYKQDVLGDRTHLLVTMAEPSTFNPKPIVFSIGAYGAVKIPHGSGGSKAAAAVVAPRAGSL